MCSNFQRFVILCILKPWILQTWFHALGCGYFAGSAAEIALPQDWLSCALTHRLDSSPRLQLFFCISPTKNAPTLLAITCPHSQSRLNDAGWSQEALFVAAIGTTKMPISKTWNQVSLTHNLMSQEGATSGNTVLAIGYHNHILDTKSKESQKSKLSNYNIMERNQRRNFLF